MKLKPKITLIDHFSKLTDPRIDRTKEHKLIDILTIAICGMICGADNWVAMEQYGKSSRFAPNSKLKTISGGLYPELINLKLFFLFDILKQNYLILISAIFKRV
jgi:hypothetical protein